MEATKERVKEYNIDMGIAVKEGNKNRKK